MPNHSNTEKRLRQDKKRRARNISEKSKIRTLVKKVRTAAAEKKSEEAMDQLRQAVSALDTAAKKNTIHPRNAARKKSRLMRLVASMGQE
ncbi:MAG: 30S ribosomal protein S20 [bacterium]|jgi:small subunit ribosomal protein S20|nr:30S ribosomal protein S20 [bacterium]